MKFFLKSSLILPILLSAPQVAAQIPLSGYFIARAECPAYQSFRRETNPGNITTEIDRAYDLIGKNKEEASHYLIKMKATPQRRWVAIGCGEHVVPAATGQPPSPEPTPSPATETANYVLAASWQAGFCETKPGKKECSSQHEDRFDATHFSLHGLWPQPRGNVYCNVAPALVAKDERSHWEDLPNLELTETTRDRLTRVMPGSQSYLHRHEWIKHGTCYGTAADEYFQDSIRLMDELNASSVRQLFADNIGREISAAQIRTAFDHSFGNGAGDRINISCKKDGNRKLITEILINLKGTPDDLTLSDAIVKAPRESDIGCGKGIVDRVGLQ
ncbi:ribonuclease T2 family protein [Methylomarinum vadi]|uniref:ribonuclease T2 family protein n=1 Tax=Methylomarinum vadi TaxID=438855 RepID=UPI0004DF3F93|nr:hypothetical protein [Methylomarinum vadi]